MGTTGRLLVLDGDKVVIFLNEKKYYFVEVRGESKLNLGKHTLVSSALVGKPYGGSFLLHNGELKQAQPFSNSTMASAATISPTEILENNSKLIDDNTSQKLSQADIVSMKEKGLSGEQVIQAIISNSATFQAKTEYSKEKYIKKKQQKHMVFIKIIKPTAKSLVKAYNFLDSSKICYLRGDSLAQLLTLSSVKAHSRPLVVETCQGLVLGAVAERMGGTGQILHGYVNSKPADPIFKLFDLPTKTAENIISFRLSLVEEIRQQLFDNSSIGTDSTTATNSNEQVTENTAQQAVTTNPPEAFSQILSTDTTPTTEAITQAPKLNKIAIERQQMTEVLKSGLADSLIIVSKYEPQSLLLGLLPLLGHGRPFVVFSQHIHLLVECHKLLRGSATHLALSETWSRIQQVLPNRTHPMMQMDGASGYLLSGISVANLPVPQISSHNEGGSNKRPRTNK